MKPLSKEERAAILDCISFSQTGNQYERCVGVIIERLLQSETYWREAVKNTDPTEIYNHYEDTRCLWCAHEFSEWSVDCYKNPNEHKLDCPYLIAQGE